MVARRKVRRARRKRSFSINLLETGAGLAFLDAANAGSAAQSFIKKSTIHGRGKKETQSSFD